MHRTIFHEICYKYRVSHPDFTKSKPGTNLSLLYPSKDGLIIFKINHLWFDYGTNITYFYIAKVYNEEIKTGVPRCVILEKYWKMKKWTKEEEASALSNVGG